MAYSTVTDVRVVLAGFADPGFAVDPDYTPANLSDAQVEYEISNADEEINAVLRRRYVLPLPAVVPAILHTLSVDIAVYLCDLIFRGSREYATILAPAELRYARARRILDSIATGDYPLYNPGEEPEGIATGGAAIVINPYPGDILLTEEVFPRGLAELHGDAELATKMIPYPFVHGGQG